LGTFTGASRSENPSGRGYYEKDGVFAAKTFPKKKKVSEGKRKSFDLLKGGNEKRDLRKKSHLRRVKISI